MNHQNFFATNLTSNVNAGDTTTPLNSIPSVDAPLYLTFDATGINGNSEVVLCTSKTATNVNHAALAYAHTTAEEVRMSVVAEEMNSIGTQLTNLTTPTTQVDGAWITWTPTIITSLYKTSSSETAVNASGSQFTIITPR
jgi:hypothetical protein